MARKKDVSSQAKTCQRQSEVDLIMAGFSKAFLLLVLIIHGDGLLSPDSSAFAEAHAHVNWTHRRILFPPPPMLSKGPHYRYYFRPPPPPPPPPPILPPPSPYV